MINLIKGTNRVLANTKFIMKIDNAPTTTKNMTLNYYFFQET